MRFKEIDYLRALAIVLMIAYHLAYDLREYTGMNINYQGPFWHAEGKLSALLFIFLSGLSSGFSRKPLQRGITIFLFGMGITLATYLFIRPEYIRFGILHFLGLAMIFSPFLKRSPVWLLIIIALISAYIGFQAEITLVQVPYLFPLGFRYNGFQSVDYYPLFPYLSVTILGIIFFKFIYAKELENPNSTLPVMPKKVLLLNRFNTRIIEGLSNNSLAIYLVHQPVILASIYLFRLLMPLSDSMSLLALTWLLVGLLTFSLLLGYRFIVRRT